VIVDAGLPVNNVCHLDTDILISPLAPNIFDQHNENLISIISQFFSLPFERVEALRRIAFLRNWFFSSDYPLDSLLFASLDQLANFSSIQVQPDYACSGVFVFNVAQYAEPFSIFFYRYDKQVLTPTDGGDELHFNYFVQSNNYANWLDYRYQALWIYEIAMHYPFLYKVANLDLSLLKRCIEASLFSNYFLHFAGSWHESKMWEQVKVFDTPESLDMFRAFGEYMKTPVYGKSLGAIKPKENS
jgi:hypothetical protein